MAENRDCKVLILTSDPATIDEVTAIGRKHFASVSVLHPRAIISPPYFDDLDEQPAATAAQAGAAAPTAAAAPS
jgi:hypothetical protein